MHFLLRSFDFLFLGQTAEKYEIEIVVYFGKYFEWDFIYKGLAGAIY